jgi:hypothetical protein
VNLEICSAASLAAAEARSFQPMNASAAPEAPIAKALRRDTARIRKILPD